MNTMGYQVVPTTSYNLEAHWPNLSITVMKDKADALIAEAVVSAPLDSRVTGRIVLSGDGLVVTPSSVEVDVSPGERIVHTISVALASAQSRSGVLCAELTGSVSQTGNMNAEIPRPADFVNTRPTGKRQLNLRAGRSLGHNAGGR